MHLCVLDNVGVSHNVWVCMLCIMKHFVNYGQLCEACMKIVFAPNSLSLSLGLVTLRLKARRERRVTSRAQRESGADSDGCWPGSSEKQGGMKVVTRFCFYFI